MRQEKGGFESEGIDGFIILMGCSVAGKQTYSSGAGCMGVGKSYSCNGHYNSHR